MAAGIGKVRVGAADEEKGVDEEKGKKMTKEIDEWWDEKLDVVQREQGERAGRPGGEEGREGEGAENVEEDMFEGERVSVLCEIGIWKGYMTSLYRI